MFYLKAKSEDQYLRMNQIFPGLSIQDNDVLINIEQLFTSKGGEFKPTIASEL